VLYTKLCSIAANLILIYVILTTAQRRRLQCGIHG